MSPRSRQQVEELLREAELSGGEYVPVDVEPAELAGIAPTLVSERVVVRVVTPQALRAQETAMSGVDLSGSGQDVVVDTRFHRERDEWDLPIAPEVYERLLEHVVTLREASATREGEAGLERVRYYRPSLTTTDVELAVGVLLDASSTPDLASAYLVGTAVAAELHAAALRLALTTEGAKVVRQSLPDPAIPAASYLDIPPDLLARRRASFDAAIARYPRELHGVFDHGMVTAELTRAGGDHYDIVIMSLFARAGKHETRHPVHAAGAAAWCQRVGAPVDAFEWSVEA